MEKWHSTTVLCVRHQGKVAMASDGQVTVGTTVMKQTAAKIRRLKGGEVLAGFAGSSADAFALFSRFESFMERGTPQVGPARFDGVRASVFGALSIVRRCRSRGVAPKTRTPDPEHGIRESAVRLIC